MKKNEILEWLYLKGIINSYIYYGGMEVKNVRDIVRFFGKQWFYFKLGFCYEVKEAKNSNGEILKVGMVVRLREDELSNMSSYLKGSGPILKLKKHPFNGSRVIATVKGTRFVLGQKTDSNINIDWLRE